MLGTMEQRTEGMKKQANELIEQAYNRGYKAGYEACKEPKDALIEKGMNMAWKAANTLNRMNMDEIVEVFADDPLRESMCREALFSCCTPELAIEKIKEYKNKKQENAKVIRVGDEVYTEDKEIKFVVTGRGEESAHLVDCNGNFAWTKTYCLNKTGRHFHEIENVLEKLKEGENETEGSDTE